MDRSTCDNPDRRPLLESNGAPDPTTRAAFDTATFFAALIYLIALLWFLVIVVTV